MTAFRGNDPRPNEDDIAIVGLGCLFPGSQDRHGYWAGLRSGKDHIEEIPPGYWDVDDYHDPDKSSPDRTYGKRGAFLSPIPFHPLEYGITPRDLEATDTSQLLGLVAAKQALEDAGYDATRTFDRSKASVILGVTGALELVVPLGARLGHPHWWKALREAGVEDDVAREVVRNISEGYVDWQENSFPGLLGNVVAGRIANRLDLHGTNCVTDAACASSLAAVHLASMELKSGRSDMVITGGVDTFNDIFMYMCFSKTPALNTLFTSMQPKLWAKYRSPSLTSTQQVLLSLHIYWWATRDRMPSREKNVEYTPLFPGPQQLEIRGGTEPLALIAGCQEAVQQAITRQKTESLRLATLKNTFESIVC